MANTKDVFRKWLNEKLRELGTDETVFGSYILSILEDDEDASEDVKLEALDEIFSEITNEHNESIRKELTTSILKKWQESLENSQSKQLQENAKKEAVPIDIELVKLIEQTQKLKPISNPINSQQYTDEEKRIKEQILTQYSRVEISDGEDEDALGISDHQHHSEGGGGGQDVSEKGSSTKIAPNTNVQTVLLRQKARREEARQEAAAKKQKDKEDRERQKQLNEEKREKRKTVKGERRR